MALASPHELVDSDGGSLKQVLKNRIINDIIKDAQSKMNKKYSLIVADDHTIRILDHVLKMHELNELNIGVVLNVNYDRERVKVSPIYFLSPNQKSVQNMCDDYKDPKSPRYGAPIHAYFCSSLPQSLIEIVKGSNLPKYLATLKEIPCDFLVLEKRVFSFDRDTAFDELYINKTHRSDELTNTAKQLVALMLSINEEPYIRFSKDSRMAGQLAQSVHQNFNQLKRNLKNFEPRQQRATLLILDRSDDPITPLLHELTFQAMVMDLLANKIENGKINMGNDGKESKMEEDVTDEEKGQDGKQMRAMPDENDEIWVQFRHAFFGDVVQKLPQQFETWKKANAVVKLQTSSNTGSGAADSRALLEAARSMPQYKTLIKKYTTNINLAHSLISLYRSYKMQDLITLEQDIVTGINEDGNKCDRTKIQQEFCNSVLLDPNKPQELKLRMFMMYVISQGGMKPETRRQLMAQSQFDDIAEQIILNLGSLGVLLQSDKPAQRGHKNQDYWKDMQKIAKKKCENNENTLMRYTSYLEWILNQEKLNELKESYFEWIEKPNNNSNFIKSSKDKVVTSYRKHKGSMANKQQTQASSLKSVGNDEKKRLIIYILGGVSFSEMCACYKFAEQNNIDVFVGSTTILSPAKYLDLLSKKLETNDNDV